MFTTGSKLFLGATAVALISTITYGVTRGGDVGWTATIGLLSATVALAFLTGINFFTRDGNVSAMQQEAAPLSGAAQPAPGRSMWPLLGALGAGLVVVGAVTVPVVFQAGLVVLLATLVEWTVQAWSERASADRGYNAALRKRILHPLELPILGAVGLGVIIYSFSRIMLFLSKTSGPIAFAVIATLVLAAGFIFALAPTIKRSITIGVCAIAGLGLVSTGAVMAIDGERHIHVYETIEREPEVCESNEETEADEKASQTVGAKSNIAAEVTFRDGRLTARVTGIDEDLTTLTLPRSNPSNIIFRNEDPEHVRLTAYMGEVDTGVEVDGQPVLEEVRTCTALVEEGGAQLLTLRFDKSSPRGEDAVPYTLTVPDVEGTAIEIVVP